MHTNRILSLLVIVALFLSACAKATTPAEPTTEAGPTEKVSPTEKPVEVEATEEPKEPEEEPTSEIPTRETVTVAIAVDPKTLDPFENNNTYVSVFSQMCEPLIMWDTDENGNAIIREVLATDYQWVDEVTLQFKLREGVTFHNGEPFNAQSAKLSLEQLFTAFNYSQWLEGMLERVDIVDDTTVNVVLTKPANYITSILAMGSYQIPFDDFQERGKEVFDQAPVCTGPWMFKEQVMDSHVSMVANPNYWGGTPIFDEVIFRVIPDDNARVAALLAGEIDIAVYMPVSALDLIESDPDVKLVTIPILRQVALYFDTSSPQGEPLKDVNVRLALNYAIDREAICNQILAGRCSLLEGQFLSKAHSGYNPDIEPYPFDPELAKQMIADAGYPDGFELDYTYLPNYKQAAEAIAGYLRDIGLTVNEFMVDYAEWARQFDNNQMTPLYTLGFLFGQEGYLALVSYIPGARFRTSEMPAAFDEAMEKASVALDDAERIKYLQEAEQALHDEPFAVYLYTPVDLYGVASWVEGFKPRVDQTYRLAPIGVIPNE